ncbi:MAG: 23S rRNA (adenine(2503)-C(2))-methyltransferase RlmN [Oscillospiraceae bacterium]|nr:23S rRNA (adenine(2503)-C(2))-methyltransferase RlmN [Oscillospiraceae bacterium]
MTALCLTLEDWRNALPDEPKFRAAQIFGWLHKGMDFDDMSNLPKALREWLKSRFGSAFPIMEDKQTSHDGTRKYLWRMQDSEKVESVAMQYSYGWSACLSVQVGCRMDCAFCATAKNGFTRNLSSGEILGQLLGMARDIGSMPSKLTLMGMGEPLDNWNNVLAFLQLAHNPDGLNMGYRHMSLSTCGLSKGLEQLLQAALPITLSISLHAPDDATRSKLMPCNKAMGVEQLIDFAKIYNDETGRRVSLEYVMIQGVTDADTQAAMLAKLLSGFAAHVNLIGLNAVTDSVYRPSDKAQVKRFAALLERRGVQVTVRRKLGEDIDAACGQLRAAVYEA